MPELELAAALQLAAAEENAAGKHRAEHVAHDVADDRDDGNDYCNEQENDDDQDPHPRLTLEQIPAGHDPLPAIPGRNPATVRDEPSLRGGLHIVDARLGCGIRIGRHGAPFSFAFVDLLGTPDEG